MKGILNALWNYPSVFAGALQVANATVAAAGVLPPLVALGVATAVAVCNFAAVTPAKLKR